MKFKTFNSGWNHPGQFYSLAEYIRILHLKYLLYDIHTQYKIRQGGVTMGRFSTKKKKEKEKCKDDQNGPIHPENWRLNFFIFGGVRSSFRADSPNLF